MKINNGFVFLFYFILLLIFLDKKMDPDTLMAGNGALSAMFAKAFK